MIFGVDDDRKNEPLRVGARIPRIPVGAPLHRRPDAVAVAEKDVVAHADLVAVVEHGRAGQAEEQGVHQLHLPAIVPGQGRQPAPDAEVDAHGRLVGKGAIHVIALFVGDHLQGQLVVIPQKKRPLAIDRDLRSLREDVHDGQPVLHMNRHEDARHDGEMKIHMAFVAVAEIAGGVFGPLVGFRQQHAVLEARVDVAAQLFQEGMRLGKVLAVGPVALEEIGHGVEAQPVDPQPEPEVDHPQHGFVHGRVVEVEIGLVGKEAVPIVLPGERIPRPVRRLEVLEDDARVVVAVGRIAPDIEVALEGTGRRPAGPLEPGVLVGGVVEHQLGDDPEAAAVGLFDEGAEVVERPDVGMDVGIVGDVISVVAPGRRIDGQEPERIDAQVLEVIELRGQSRKIADSVAIRIHERAHPQLVDDGVLEPLRVVAQLAAAHLPGLALHGALLP